MAQPHGEYRHIAVLPVSGTRGGAHGDDLHARQPASQCFHHLGHLPHMRKNGLALAKAALSLPDRQKHAFSGYHRAMLVHRRRGGGIATGVKTQGHAHWPAPFPHAGAYAFDSCLSRTIAPRTPLM